MHDAHHDRDTWVQSALLVLVVVLLILCALLFHEYRTLRQQDLMGPHGPGLHGGGATMTDANLIQSWMTYDYIGHVYALPPDYLKTTLNIADTRYPRISIAESAEAQKVSASELLAQVRSAVSDYLVTNGR